MHIALLQFYANPTAAYDIIAAELRQRGHTVWVGSSTVDDHLQWHDGERVVAVLRGPFGGPPRLRRLAFLRFILRVRAFLRQHNPDVVQVNPARLNWVEVLPLRMPASMVFLLDFRQIGQRDASSLPGKIKNELANWRRRFSARFVYHRALFLHAAGGRKLLGPGWQRSSEVVPLGVDPQFLDLRHTDANLRYNTKDTDIVRFIYVGRRDHERKLELVLQAARQMRSVSDQFHITFLGPDITGGYYEGLVTRWGLENVISTQPPVPYAEVPAALLRHDVALAYVPDFPSDWRYHPTLKVLEYRALGIPIVASDHEPNREVVRDGVNGVLVQNTADSLAAGMLRFVTDRALLRQCQANAQSMREGLRWVDVADQYEALYTRLQGATALAAPRGSVGRKQTTKD
jgi:glycosyltransferase involved in cell wall biosynthesis